MKVVSLFDGISCARLALKRARIGVDQYYASEIDLYALKISQNQWPRILESVTKQNHPFLFDRSVDLLIGGSPCQDLSIAKSNRAGLKGDRSGLFWEYVRILEETKPTYFVLENVASMSKDDRSIITETLGVEPIMIDAALVSAQRRKRLFWTNIKGIEQPRDRGIYLKDILEDGVSDDKAFCVDASYFKGGNEKTHFLKKKRTMVFANDAVYQYRRTYWRETKGGKVPTLTANMGSGGHNVPFVIQRGRGRNKGGIHDKKTPTINASRFEENHRVYDGKYLRKLTPVECERLQSLPDGYTEGVSNTQRYKAIGNAFNVDVVAHILRHVR